MEVLTHICINLSSILNKLNKITTIYIYIVVILDNDTTYSDMWKDPDQGLQKNFACYCAHETSSKVQRGLS